MQKREESCFLKDVSVKTQTLQWSNPFGTRGKKPPPFSNSVFDMQYTTLLISLKTTWAFIPPSMSEILSQSGSIVIIAILRPSAGSRLKVLKKGMWLRRESKTPGSL